MSMTSSLSSVALQKPKEKKTRVRKSKPVGVRQRANGRFDAVISARQYRTYLGRFKTAEQAAVAYNVEALARFGPAAPLNTQKATKTHLYTVRIGGKITSRCGRIEGTLADIRAQWRMRPQAEITCERCAKHGEK